MDYNEVRRALGREIAAERVRRGWTQQELADQADGITKRQVGKIERGEAGQLDEAMALAAALGVSFAKLATEAEARASAQGTIDLSR